MQVYLVAPHQLIDVWEKVKPLISAACEHNNNRYNSEDYIKNIKVGRMQLWIALANEIKGIAITMIVNFPRKKCCVIDVFTGSGLEELLEFLPLIERWAIENGCKQMFAHTRIGLSRKLKSQGYHATHTVLEKDI